MKSIYKYIAVLTIVILALAFIIANRYNLSIQFRPVTRNNIFKYDAFTEEKQDEFQITDIKDINASSPLNKMYKVKNASAFSLSYSKDNNPSEYIKKDDTFKFRDFASDGLYFIFRESYPNITLDDMGLETQEEAYQAEQLAIWEIAARTGEAHNADNSARIKAIKNEIGKNNLNKNVVKRAEQLVKFIENQKYNEGFNLVSTLFLNTESVTIKKISDDGTKIIGPYKYRVESGFIEDAKVTLTDENGQPFDGKIVGSNGAEMDNVKDYREFYVMTNKETADINIKLEVSVKRLAPAIYENEAGNEIIVNTYVSESTDSTAKVHLKND